MKQDKPQGPCWRVEWRTEHGYETSEGMSEGQAKFFCENIRQWVRNPRVIYVIARRNRGGKEKASVVHALDGKSTTEAEAAR